VILIFCAFGAEFGPLRARLQDPAPFNREGFTGASGRINGNAVTLIKTGVGIRRARDTAVRALDALHEINLVAITGVAGALHHELAVGNVVLADRLITRQEQSFHPNQILEVPRQPFQTFANALDAGGIRYSVGGMLTSRRAIATIADKRLAAAQSGAVAVDMESAVIADEAQRRGMPFVCLRTILDAAGDELMGAALADENGRVRPLAAAKAMVTNPAMLIGTARLVRNLRRSTRVLAAVMEAVLGRVA
jgi:adenosylhomocysteine nucleosidase